MTYEYNEFFVCTNPSKVGEYHIEGYSQSSYILVSEYKGKWYYGYNVSVPDFGACCGCNRSAKGYPSRLKAIEAALDRIQRMPECNVYKLNQFLSYVFDETHQLKLF